MIQEKEKKEGQQDHNFENFIELVRENWLSFVLAGLGLVLVVVGGVVMVRERSGQPGEEVVIEEEGVEKEKVTVEIQGAVVKPGVYHLPFNSRVQDLLIEAGGLSKEADEDWVTENLNQAAKLKDGEKYYLPKKGEGQTVDSQSSATGKININTASLAQLDSLPEIGPARGQKIIDNRPYSRLEELLEKEVISSSVFEKIKDRISVY